MNPKTEIKAEGGILSIVGFILFFDFMSVDASIFNYEPPHIITQISQLFTVSPFLVDILTTLAIIILMAMLKTERKLGAMEL